MLMDEMGIDRIDVDGAVVKLKSFVSASIPADRKQEAFNRLREHGHEGIIKNEIVVLAKVKTTPQAMSCTSLKRRAHPEQKTHIHSMTLKGFIREQVQKGNNIDLDLFGAFVGRTAEVKRNSK